MKANQNSPPSCLYFVSENIFKTMIMRMSLLNFMSLDKARSLLDGDLDPNVFPLNNIKIQAFHPARGKL